MRTILSLFFLFSLHASAGPQMPMGSTYGGGGVPGGGTVGQYLSLCSGGPCWAGVSGGVAIGSAVTSGTSGSALYVDSGGLLAQSNSLYKFAATTGGSTASGSSSSDGVLTVPDGTWSGSPSTFFGVKPGLRFVDDGNSAGDGWLWRKDTVSNVGWMVAAMNGQWMMGFRHNRDGANGGQGSKEIVVQAPFRADTAGTVNGQAITLGVSSAPWKGAWIDNISLTYNGANGNGNHLQTSSGQSGIRFGNGTLYSDGLWFQFSAGSGTARVEFGAPSTANVANTIYIQPTDANTGTLWGTGVTKAYSMRFQGQNASTASGTGTTITSGGDATIAGGNKVGAGTAGQIFLETSGLTRWKIDDAGVLNNVTAANESTGAGSAALGANCPATTATAPYTWVKMKSSDGSTVYVPAWK